MIRSELSELKDHILGLNKYFHNGYEYCFKETKAEAIFAKTSKGYKVIFPEDRAGNYFFFLLSDEITFKDAKPLSDCNRPMSMQIDTVDVKVVAVVDKKGDVFQLLSNLRNSIKTFNGKSSFSITSANITNEKVILSLMRGFGKEEILRTLGNSDTKTLVSLSLKMSLPFTYNGCLTKICKECNVKDCPECEEEDGYFYLGYIFEGYVD